MKKLLSLLLAAILAFSLALPAFAADPAPGQYKVTYTDPSGHFQTREFTVKAGEKAPAYNEVKPQYGNSVFSTWNYRYKNITDPTTVTVNENITFTAYWEKLPELTPEIAKQKCLLRITDNERPGTGYDIKNGKLIDGTYSISKLDYDANNKVAYATVTIAAASFDAYSVNLEGGAGDYIYHFRELGEHAKDNTDSEGNLVIHLKSQGVYVGAVDQTLGLQFREWEMDPAYYPDKALPQLLLDRYYTVTYIDGANGDAFGVRVLEAKENSPAPAFGSDPTREGYKFTGWDKPVSDKVTEHLTYTAQWEANANAYTVKYIDGINGAIFAEESHTAKYGDPTPAFEGSTDREGYKFLGWEPEVAETVTEDATYTAKWDKLFTVTYKDPYKNFEEQVYYVEKGGKVPAFVGTPTREGYIFSTWNGVYEAVNGPAGETVTKDRVFSARWTQLPKDLDAATAMKKVTLRVTDALRPNGNYDLRTESLIDGTFTVGASEWNAEKKAVLATVTISKADFEKYGASLEKIEGFTYHFSSLGTYTDTDSEGNLVIHLKNSARYKGDSKYSNRELYFGGWLIDTDYYPSAARAQLLFDRYYTVTYTDGINGEAFADVSVEAKENEPTPEFVGTPTRSGYTFKGWSPVAAEKVTADATYVAQWERNTYTVSFNCNGGEACAPITVTYGKAYGNLPFCFVDGMQNLGWYLVDAEGNVTDTYIGERTLVTEARNHELFQKREIKKPTVKLNLSRPVYNYLEEPVTIQSSGITEYPALKYSYQWYKDGTALTDGKIYEGSNTANLTLKHDYVSCSGLYKLVVTISVADNSGIVSANGTVTAEASYDLLIRRSSNMVIYDANGGQGGPLNDSDYYDKANDRYVAKLRGVDAIPNSPLVREGYHFLGWNTKADGTGDSYKPGDFYVFDRELSENGGLRVTLYAMWEACAGHLVDVKVLKAPTCTEKGLKLCRCKVCGVEYEVEMPALGHDLSGWIWNRTEHWKKCRRCGELFEVDKHTLTEWKDILRNGEIVPEHHCVVCGFSECGSVIHIDGTKKPQAGVEENPNTGAEVPSLLPALAVLAGAAVLLRKKK